MEGRIERERLNGRKRMTGGKRMIGRIVLKNEGVGLKKKKKDLAPYF